MLDALQMKHSKITFCWTVKLYREWEKKRSGMHLKVKAAARCVTLLANVMFWRWSPWQLLTRQSITGVLSNTWVSDRPYYTAPFKASAWLEGKFSPGGEEGGISLFLMMYNWPPNTRAQQTLSGCCNSTLPFTYRPVSFELVPPLRRWPPSNWQLCVFALNFIKLALKYSCKKKGL